MYENHDHNFVSDSEIMKAADKLPKGELSDWEKELWDSARRRFKANGKLDPETRDKLVRSLGRYGWCEVQGWDQDET